MDIINKNSVQTKIDPEVIIIDDYEYEKPLPKEHKSGEKKKITTGKSAKDSKRKVRIDSSSINGERLIITQKVMKQKIKCIINVKTVCHHEDKCSDMGEKNEKKDSKKPLLLERETPRCSRLRCLSCSSVNTHGCQLLKEMKSRKRISPQTSMNNKPRTSPSKRAKTSSNQKPKTSSNITPVSSPNKAYTRILLSPISSSTLELSNDDKSLISYESISSGSWESEGELDTLIKRTKDRENQTKPLDIDEPPGQCNLYIEVSSDDENNNGSLHSAATFVLGSRLDLYSPTHPTGTTKSSSLKQTPTYTEISDQLDANIKQDYLYTKAEDFSSVLVKERSYTNSLVGLKGFDTDIKLNDEGTKTEYSSFPTEEKHQVISGASMNKSAKKLYSEYSTDQGCFVQKSRSPLSTKLESSLLAKVCSLPKCTKSIKVKPISELM